MKKLLLIALLLTGCIKTQTVLLNPEPDACQFIEVRNSTLSTQTMTVCWDKLKNVTGTSGGNGMPVAQVPLSILGAGAAISSSVILSNGLIKAGQSIFDASKAVPTNFTHTGHIDTDGTLTHVGIPDNITVGLEPSPSLCLMFLSVPC